MSLYKFQDAVGLKNATCRVGWCDKSRKATIQVSIAHATSHVFWGYYWGWILLRIILPDAVFRLKTQKKMGIRFCLEPESLYAVSHFSLCLEYQITNLWINFPFVVLWVSVLILYNNVYGNLHCIFLYRKTIHKTCCKTVVCKNVWKKL